MLQVVALQIMRANYEQLVKAHQRAPQVQEDLVPDEVKFQVWVYRREDVLASSDL